MKRQSIPDRVKGLRLEHLILSLGWKGAQEYLKSLSDEEKSHYFSKRSES